MAHANSQTIVIALIEHIDALQHLDDILAVDGIDLYSVGPKDLAQSMGLPGQMEHPDVLSFISTVQQSVSSAGKAMSGEAITLQLASQFFLDAATSFINSRS